jgi:hypothetical protein
MRQVYNGVYFYLVKRKKDEYVCASFYWEYVIMYLEFMFKRTQ